MYKSPLANIFQILSTIAAIIGIVFYFINPVVAIICGIISLLNSVIQVVWGDQNNLTTEIITVIVGIIVALIIGKPIIYFTCFILCVTDILMLVMGWIYMLLIYRRYL